MRRDSSGTFLRGRTQGEAMWISRPNGHGYHWNLESHPRLSWRWRAHSLPQGARETSRKANDAGAALYVIFSRDFFGRPRAIKYTWSSSLPEGTVADYGRLKVLVVASGLQPGWHGIERDVAADYRTLFDRHPPDEPVALAVWSDSDSTGDEARVDFDDIELLPR